MKKSPTRFLDIISPLNDVFKTYIANYDHGYEVIVNDHGCEVEVWKGIPCNWNPKEDTTKKSNFKFFKTNIRLSNLT